MEEEARIFLTIQVRICNFFSPDANFFPKLNFHIWKLVLPYMEISLENRLKMLNLEVSISAVFPY